MIKLTPSELIDKYPQVADKWGWDARFIGNLLSYKVLDGSYNRTNKVSLVAESSFIELMTFLNNRIKQRVIDL